MSFSSMLYSFLFMPLQLLFEITYSLALRVVGNNYGLAIIALSLVINILVLPLYNRADAIQEEERRKEESLEKGVSHIKKTFRGDERTMMLQTYYRQNSYSPLHALRSATSLLLEIPFFVAAYRFLSSLEVLKFTSFGPIADLGMPDALITVGGISINLLPVLMTALNLISALIFTKNSPLKTKLQLYGMALFFLVFLYDSPSGLVFYWTLNNLFSLVKTIFYKLKNPKKVLLITVAAVGVCSVLAGLMGGFSAKIKLLALMLGILLCIPLALSLLDKKIGFSGRIRFPEPNKKLFTVGSLFLTLLTGLLIPSAVISASAQEFVIMGIKLHPVWYIVSAFLIAAGTFILWLGVFYRLFSDKAKVVFERVIVIGCFLAIINYLFFDKNFGTMSSQLVYDINIGISRKQMLINLFVLLSAAVIVYVLTKLKEGAVRFVITASSVAILCMSCLNLTNIFKSVSEVSFEKPSNPDNAPIIHLSKTEKNVVVFMLDRALGEYLPFIFDEEPELKDKYAGFTYYENTVSFGGHTNYGAPALFGGYEYTPAEMNKRDSEPLVEKHNEALKMMPVLFRENGFDVTVCDPPYAGYNEIPDLSIYDEYPDIKTHITQEMFIDDDMNQSFISIRYRNFFCHSIFRIAPTLLKGTLYKNGSYGGFLTASGSKAYNALKELSNITSTDNSKGSFVMINNDTTHSSSAFPEPEYINADDDKIKSMLGSTLSSDGKTLKFDRLNQIYSFQNNLGALKKIGEWLDYLREQAVYDNTRIIFVSDHGYAMKQMDNFIFDETAYNTNPDKSFGDLEFYYPLLLVKDFDSSEFSVSDEFMTNADVPALATSGVIDKPVNPFTGKMLGGDEKTGKLQYIISSPDFWVTKNNGNTFLPARWYSVHDSIWDINNWELVTENAVLPN